jgi:hypothetical protein
VGVPSVAPELKESLQIVLAERVHIEAFTNEPTAQCAISWSWLAAESGVYPSSRSECQNPSLKAAKGPDTNTRDGSFIGEPPFRFRRSFLSVSPPRLCRLKTHGVFAVADENRSSRHIPKVGIPFLTTGIRKGWVELGETTFRRTFQHPIFGATERRDRPGWMSNGRLVRFRAGSFLSGIAVNYLLTTEPARKRFTNVARKSRFDVPRARTGHVYGPDHLGQAH